MKKYFEQKVVSDSVKDVSESDRRVKVAISQVGSLDLDNDVIEAGAYTKTITERGPKGANLIWHLTDHNASLKNAVGKFSELYMENNYLVGVTNIPNTSWGNDVLEFYKTGHINQHSVGFKTIKSEDTKDGSRLLKELFLYEGSAVLWGANPNTPTLAKSMTKDELIAEHEKLSKELSLLMKSLKDDRFTDEAFEFIEIRAAQINENIKNLLSTEITLPVEKTVEPVNTEGLDIAIKELLTILKN
jgi:HK97 family phage prohead protease